MLTYMRFSDASLLNKSISSAYYDMLGDADILNQEVEQYENITKEDLRDFANKYLNISQSNTLYYLSKA